jgi:hypothetical protein
MLRYVTDFKHLRACGATDGDMINVREFVLKATGIPSRNHSGP